MKSPDHCKELGPWLACFSWVTRPTRRRGAQDDSRIVDRKTTSRRASADEFALWQR
jgi:hypothetical protein